MSEIAPISITVSQAITICNTILGDTRLSIEGEIANYTVSRGQFVFFDLKDEEQEARLSCFMMLTQQHTPLEDGMRVIVHGKPNIFMKSGKFSITAQKVEPKGEGSVKRAFELLRKKLTEEGLFSDERKRPIPRFVQKVGIISSTEAAGYSDFMRIADQRLRGISYVTAHVAVQGKDAEDELCGAFDYLNSYHELDCIVLIRGGGSIEDLHAFNSELLARAIVRSKVPVLVGIGHERDNTIADYCADLRAATPSNAAHLLLPTREEVENEVIQLVQLGHHTAIRRIQLEQENTVRVLTYLQQCQQSLIEGIRNNVNTVLKTVTALSPSAILQKGYSITWKEDGSLVRSASDVATGTTIRTQLAHDEINSVTI